MVVGQRNRIERRTQADVRAVDQGRGEVGPSDRRSGRDPGPPARPAADVGRIEQVLAQPPAPLGQHGRARRRVEHLEGPHRAHDIVNRAGDAPAQIGDVEEQPRPKHRRDAPANVQFVRPKSSGERLDRAFVNRPLAEELVAQPPGQPPGRRGMVQEQRRQAVGVECGRAAEDGRGARVVPRGNEPKLITHEPPAGQDAGRLLDIVLGIGTDTEREELHQLAGQVLIGLAPGVIGRVQPDEQGRVAEHRPQERSERGPAERAQGLVLPPHQRHVVDLAVAGGEVAMPQEREALRQRVRAEEHAVDPPGLEATGVGRGQRPVGQAVGERGEIRGDAAGSGLPLQEPVDRRFGAVLQIALELLPGGGKAGPAVQVDDPPRVPGHSFVGDIGRPGVARPRSHGVSSHRLPPSRAVRVGVFRWPSRRPGHEPRPVSGRASGGN